ncbi:MAG: response regulator [Pseudooceanicola sp.]|nr:response regulator [Pseudooceanicola sp.]
MPSDPVRFLLVDDLDDNLNALEGLLEREGLDLHRAQSGTEALEKMLSHRYALALLDVQMPGMDGYELAELMRGSERTRKVPIIFLTAADFDERRVFRGYEAGAVDYITKPIDPMILKSKAQVFFELGVQAQELAEQRDRMTRVSRDLAGALARVKAHRDNSPLGVVELDNALVVRDWTPAAERMFGRPASALEGRCVEQSGWLMPGGAEALRAFVDEAAAGPVRKALMLSARHAGGHVLDCECYVSVIPAQAGAEQSVTLQLHDVTERRRAEETRSTLVGELNHRVKNTLANVQAIARQTLRQTPEPAAFAKTFGGRLQSLAGAHAILSAESWSSADLRQLIVEQFHQRGLSEGLSMAGPAVRLPPDSALRLALSLHELGTNAVKYGALSVPQGRVAIRWEVEGDAVRLTWAETGGPAVEPPAHTGFGLTLIAGGPGGGDEGAQADWRPDGVVWTIRLSLAMRKASDTGRPFTEVATKETPRTQEAGAGSPDLRGARVLIVEDEPIIALDVATEIEDAGGEVVGIARTVPNAMTMIRQTEPDAVVLDGNLGGQRVDEIARELLAKSIRFCFASGYGREHLPANMEFIDKVDKPFNQGDISGALARLLAKPVLARTDVA